MKNVAPVIVRTPLPVGLEGLGTQAGTQDRVEAMLGISGLMIPDRATELRDVSCRCFAVAVNAVVTVGLERRMHPQRRRFNPEKSKLCVGGIHVDRDKVLLRGDLA